MSGEQSKKLLNALTKLKKTGPMLPPVNGDVPFGTFFMLHGIQRCVEEKRDGEGKPGVKISTLSAYAGMSMPAVSQILKPHTQGKPAFRRRYVLLLQVHGQDSRRAGKRGHRQVCRPVEQVLCRLRGDQTGGCGSM